MGPAATRRVFGARKDRPAPAQIVFETDLKIEDNEMGPVYRLVTRPVVRVGSKQATALGRRQVLAMHGAVTDNNATLFARRVQLGPRPPVHQRHLQVRRTTSGYLDARCCAHRIPADLRRSPQHQCRAHAQMGENGAPIITT